MRTNIVLDEALTQEAFALTGLKTKSELINYALLELVRLRGIERGGKSKSIGPLIAITVL